MKQNAMKLYLEFPSIAAKIRQIDVSMRVKYSPTAIRLKLYHKYSNYNPCPDPTLSNVVAKAIGILVVNTNCNGHKYEPGLCKNSITGRYYSLTVEE